MRILSVRLPYMENGKVLPRMRKKEGQTPPMRRFYPRENTLFEDKRRE